MKEEQQPLGIDPGAFLIGMLIALILVGAYFLYQYLRFRKRKKQTAVTSGEARQILSQHFAYYRMLDSEQQTRFEQRVLAFANQKTFIPRNMERVTVEMQVLISAAMAQLTFGLPPISLQHFQRIIVYPDQYYSTVTEKMHKGEVNPGARAIVLSWRNFLKGYAIPDDSLNLGLHEMAHALELENLIENREYNFFRKEPWQDFKEESARISEMIKKGETNFFREYATTNEKEFFAVAVENFFERPKAFCQKFPRMYGIMIALLNQDPLAITNDGFHLPDDI
ncbi:MAG: zinc-dependent peptidase [Cyclobacteriaceae bacterium]